MQYEKTVAAYQPDRVLGAFFVGNDLADNCRRLSSNPRVYFDVDEHGELCQRPYSGHLAIFSELLNRYSCFYAWQKHLVRRVRKRARSLLGHANLGRWVYCKELSSDVGHT